MELLLSPKNVCKNPLQTARGELDFAGGICLASGIL